MRSRLATFGAVARDDRALAVTAVATAVGAVLRVAWVVVAARPPAFMFDPARYAGYARVIAEGRGLVEPFTGQATAYYPPGYPYFLGGINAVLVHTPVPGDLPLVAGLVQALLGTASIVLAGLLARRLHSPAAGAVAAVGMAVYPNLVLHTAVLLSETLAVALLLGLMVALVPPPGSEPWPAGLDGRRLVGAGILLGGLLLVRPVSAGIVVALAVALLVARVGLRRAAAVVGVVAGVGLLCVAPWTIRNAVRMGAFVPISTNTGDNLCIGHGAEATGGFRLGPDTPDGNECYTGESVAGGTDSELRNDRTKTRIALRLIRENWRDEPRLAWERLVILFERDDDAVWAVQSYPPHPESDPWMGEGWTEALSRSSNGAWALVAVVGAVGMVRLGWGRRPDQVLVPLTALGLLAVPLVTFADTRFKVPMVPLLIVAAAIVGVEVARRFRPPAGAG